MIKLKICGLSRIEDIEAVNIIKPDYIGFVFAKSRRQVTFEQAAALRKNLSKNIIPVGVFVNEKPEVILSAVNNGIIEIIQLHGSEDEAYIKKLKTITGKPIIKAVSVSKAGDAKSHDNSFADYLLLDNKGGGTGECFDWSLIGRIKKPYFLAGGIDITNIEAAMKLNPYCIDVSGGVEENGKKSKEKMEALNNIFRGRQK